MKERWITISALVVYDEYNGRIRRRIYVTTKSIAKEIARELEKILVEKALKEKKLSS